jgi:site-specific DNA recombinase
VKTIIYTRVSTASQTEGTSLESQEAACRKLAKDADVVHEVYSGAYLHDRPELSKIRDKIEAGYYKRFVCHSIDRLSRNIGHLAILLDQFERYGVTLEFVTEKLDSTPEGKLLHSVKGYAAEVEREKIRERTMRGRRHAALNGTYSYRRKLFGYDVHGERRTVNEAEADIVRRLFHSVIGGTSLRRLSGILNKEGIRTPHGSIWWPHSIKSILDNPAYCGRTTVFRFRHHIHYVEGRKVHNGSALGDPASRIEIPDATPAIVTEEEWNAAQNALKRNVKMRGRIGQKEFLLRGLIRCATCGRQFSPVGKKGHRYYVCTSTQNARNRGSEKHTIPSRR